MFDLNFALIFTDVRLPVPQARNVRPYRSDAERDAFRASLKALQFLYAHQHTWVWLLKAVPPSVKPKYDERGWPHFEQSISAWIKDRSKRLDLSRLAMAPTQVKDFYRDVERVSSLFTYMHRHCAHRR